MIRLSEQVRRLEDTIESLRRDNQDLRDKLKTQELPEFITFKGTVKETPKKGEDGDLYFIEYSDGTRAEVVWYNGELEPLWKIKDMYAKSEYTKKLEEKNKSLKKENQELRSNEYIKKLEIELQERVKQVENLQDTLKKITKENLELQEKLNTGCCNKRCKKTTRDDDKCFDDNFRRIFKDFLGHDF